MSLSNLATRLLVGGTIAAAGLFAVGPAAIAAETTPASAAREMDHEINGGVYETNAYCVEAGRREVNQNGALGYRCETFPVGSITRWRLWVLVRS